MTATVAALLPLLAFAASTAGAGWLASRLFDRLRAAVPRPTAAQWARLTALGRLAVTALYAPRWARMTVFLLAWLVATLASVATSTITGRAALPALDAALAVIVSQVAHAAGLPAHAEARTDD